MLFRTCTLILVWMASLALAEEAKITTDKTAETQPAQEVSAADDGKWTCRPFALDAPTMTDDWFGAGPTLRDMGIGFNFIWNHYIMSALGGGLETGTKGSATYDLLLTLDFEKMGLIKGGDMLVHARQQWGASVNAYTGANQQVNDDADGDRGIYVDQLWYRQHFLDKKIALQVGYLDYQTIVDRNAFANSEDKQFMNAALDNNPLIPTASMAGLGAALYVKPCDWYTLILGAGDAQRLPLYKPGFSTAFHDEAWFIGYMEHDFHIKIPTERGPLAGNYRIGLVYDPTPRTEYRRPWQSVDRRGDNYSLYLSFDQMLFRENEKDDQGLGLFFRFAYQDDKVYRFNQFYSGGFQYKGLIPTRDRDVFGFAVAALVDSNEYRENIDANSGNETIYEWYYAIGVTPWLVVTPDLQYIDNPGANDNVSHAIAGGVRFRITF